MGLLLNQHVQYLVLVGDIRCQMFITTRIPLPLLVSDGGIGPTDSPGEMLFMVG